MPTIEPTVSEEKLRQLLDEGHESDLLDFKDTCNLDETRDRVELAKDIGAMQVDGGYIVIGADEHGKPTGLINAELAAMLDESVIRKKVLKYLPEPLEIRAATHRIGEALLAVVYVGPNPNGMAIFRADGNHPGGQAFRMGDVFVRHGTSSERWQQHDIARIYIRAVAALKETWRAEVADSIRQSVNAGQHAQELGSAPSEALDWRLDADTFASTAIEQLRRGDDIPLRLALDRIEVDAGALYSTGFAEEMGTLLDRLTCLAALFIRIGRVEWLEEVVQRLLAIYAIPMQASPVVQDQHAATLWLAIAERVESLGALAVRRRLWDIVRRLGLLKTPGRQEYYRYLLRHVVVRSGNAGLLEPKERKGVSLVSLARAVVERLDCLRPGLSKSDERILDSICQFDFLAALAAIADRGEVDTAVFYTSFAYFFSERTEPIIERLLEDPQLRNQIFPGSDTDLAAALQLVSRYATSEGFRFSGWDGISSREILDFIRRHTANVDR